MDELEEEELRAEDVVDEPLKDEAWRNLEIDDASSVASETSSTVSAPPDSGAVFRMPPALERIVEDSEADSDIEILK